MDGSQVNYQADVEAVGQITAVPTILQVVCQTTGMGFAAVARVTKERWVACAVRDEIQFGLLPGGELKLETTICHEIHLTRQPVVIDHVAKDKVYCNHHTPAMYGFQSYISMPIILKDGSFFGTLCAIDPRPAELDNARVRGMFKLFADLIAFHLNALDEIAATTTNLQEERKTSELREHFIAILGHDLRNPVSAISNSAQMLRSSLPLDERSERLVNVIQNSSGRIAGLIDNMLDFARGRLGNGIILDRKKDIALEKSLQQVIAELQVNWPEREIKTNFDLQVAVDGDTRRIAQVLSNLLTNALKYGDTRSPVLVHVSSDENKFNLSVTNFGAKMQASSIERVFKPFSRVEVEPYQQGLGLGLYIAAEIAKAHGGEIGVTSTDEETVFSFRISAK